MPADIISSIYGYSLTQIEQKDFRRLSIFATESDIVYKMPDSMSLETWSEEVGEINRIYGASREKLVSSNIMDGTKRYYKPAVVKYKLTNSEFKCNGEWRITHKVYNSQGMEWVLICSDMSKYE